ncbi:voltage-dependent calcium channel subunit alpha-2/delta-3 isoform X5 [Leptopilina boulardi]|uniref:voltage-dependent calcium channel subunit alpha-2/delta-3 isoform X5 n=1 Tax=Leptopilina boulardi TaxID=63433 RepID=UPI0021F5ECBB|nr:voltage-dependent calcium channel subunit alpha-2/delta-3 isoform X5 [Leptopilina boulardi]
MRSWLLSFFAFFIIIQASTRGERITFSPVKVWARKLGFELSQLGKYVTNVEKFQATYQHATVQPKDGSQLVKDIAKDIKAMMESKISAIKRIMDVAQKVAESAPDVTPSKDYLYVNAKNNTIDLTNDYHFGGLVNLSMSAVHVPTNVYDRAPEVIRAIKWSEELDKIFVNNYQQDPSLSWQYFGSATGFMRQFPATNWQMEEVDLFDCRTRSWYIEAATSPKDILILVDTSGSMTGIRKEIARHVVNNILDTLGNNDFVNIITFSNETSSVVKCFSNRLVQANLANIRELKKGIQNMTTERIANFSMVLSQAFEMLAYYRASKEGADCNQAIMLITDGVPENYKDTFKYYNWYSNPDNPDQADMPVRIFTYLIGREVADYREVKWMACANRGYFVHLSTMAEVREQVLNYIPVMARPLVLKKTDHPTIWTPVYADIEDPKMTDWLWEQNLCSQQKLMVLRSRMVNQTTNDDDDSIDEVEETYFRYQGQQKYRLMTSVSTPVYDTRSNANITEQVLVKEAYWVEETRETKIAKLLGVAGTDVPITEIQRFMMPHTLGVNGYAFLVTNNGYILTHPDLRPVFQNILKPAYNSVDMVEVELVDQDRGPRDFDDALIALRDDVINQKSGSVTLHTRYHYDDMQRVGRVRRKYDYMGIENTTFTVVVSLPEYDQNGNYRIHAAVETKRLLSQGTNVLAYFSGNNWRVHPDWIYCKYHYDGEFEFRSPEDQLLHFLNRTRQQEPPWRWIDAKQRSQPPEKSNASSKTFSKSVDSYYCDRRLLLNLVHDAQVTQWFANASSIRDEKGLLTRLMKLLPRKEFWQRFGFTVSFMATHSGLTRWQEFHLDDDIKEKEENFGSKYPRAIDEIWYKRAVEQHYVYPESFVFSVPIIHKHRNLINNSTLVTASRAVFVGSGTAKAPVGVVGFQFLHSALQGLFQNITDTCENCTANCKHPDVACYLIDNHGYILASNDDKHAARFLGEVRGTIMKSLIHRGIFNKVTIYDYQAVCFPPTAESNVGNILITPWKLLRAAASWFFAHAAWAIAKAGIWHSDYAYANMDLYSNQEFADDSSQMSDETREARYYDKIKIKRTRPQSCDKEVDLYLLNHTNTKEYDVDSDRCARPYVIQPVELSNMLLLIIDTTCPEIEENNFKIMHTETFEDSSLMSLACMKAVNSTLKRKRPMSCVRSHRNESEIRDQCGHASNFKSNFKFIIISLVISCYQLRLYFPFS